jgi:anaerobic selenocysteine-containing dehydrogenase
MSTAGRRCANAALQWPPERAAATCGITADEVRQLARDYGTTRRRRSA